MKAHLIFLVLGGLAALLIFIAQADKSIGDDRRLKLKSGNILQTEVQSKKYSMPVLAEENIEKREVDCYNVQFIEELYCKN